MNEFKPNGLPLLIGSLPLDDHQSAVELVLETTPDIPLWVQLPRYAEEGMIAQFMEGLPGVDLTTGKNRIDTDLDGFDAEMLAFFEDYLALSESDADLNGSRFALNGTRARGFREFLAQIDAAENRPVALKGQVTGPISFCTAVKDQHNKDIFYHDQLRDAAIKKLALNARWQADAFSKRDALPIIFIDEPALSGFGTSAYMTLTREHVTDSIEEIVHEIHACNGLAGVHVCGNTQWDMLLKSAVDIISFDTFAYFDRFILYPEALTAFLERGKILAWGIVPTLQPDIIMAQTVQGLSDLLESQIKTVSRKTGFSRSRILSQSLITPSCGTGSLDKEKALHALRLTKALAEQFRQD